MNAEQDQFGKVAVLMGGWSSEREISLRSGRAVLEGLQQSGVDAHGVDVTHDIANQLLHERFDRAFIMLHGRGGEDGVIQGLLEAMAIPYTGSGVLGSSLAMDKLRSKQIWSARGLPTPDYVVLDSAESCTSAIHELGLPMFVKPVLEGSSIGMTFVEHEDDLIPAWRKAEKHKGAVIAERWVQGNEYTMAILGKQLLPMIQLQTSHKFYDYAAKYESNDTQYICPCGLDEDDERFLARMMLKAFRAVDAAGWGRVDFMVDEDGQPWIIEVNTVPGMTDHSLVPMAAKHIGMTFNELVVEILRGSCATDK